jgi:hypothetical protein
MIGGSITVDQTVLGSKGKTKTYLTGTPSAGPIADNWDNPKWKTFVAAYKKAYPNGFPSPSLFAHGYYVEALAMMQALDTVHGDLSDGQKAFREALASETVDTPTGMVKLDKNRNAVADLFHRSGAGRGQEENLYTTRWSRSSLRWIRPWARRRRVPLWGRSAGPTPSASSTRLTQPWPKLFDCSGPAVLTPSPSRA